MKENKDLIIVAIASFFIGFGVASLFGGDVDTAPRTREEALEDTTLPPLPFKDRKSVV